MAQILVRGLRTDVIERWKARAKRNNRSLVAEVRQMLEQHIDPDPGDFDEAVRFADEMRVRLAGRLSGPDSTEIIRAHRGG
jgi:plasmid stability protein